MIDLNIGVTLLSIGVLIFGTFVFASSSCFMSEFENFRHTLLIISGILICIGVWIISLHVVFI